MTFCAARSTDARHLPTTGQPLLEQHRMAPDKPRRMSGEEFTAKLYDKWAVPLSDEPDAPSVTSLHDGLDWVQVHAPRSFFEELAAQVAAGDTEDLQKWLTVWATARKEPDPTRCGKPTRTGAPCHHEKPCRYHPSGSERQMRQRRRRYNR